jgi:O-antigen ligase
MGEGHAMGRAGRWIVIGCVAYPWLHFRAAGPWPVVEPALATLACVIVLLAIAWRHAPLAVPRSIVLTAASAIALLWAADAVARGDVVPSPAVVFSCMVLAAIATCALVVRGGDREEWAGLLAQGWLLAALASTVIAFAQLRGVEHWFGGFASPSPTHHAFANLRQRNHFATLACIGLASAVYLGVRARAEAMRLVFATAAVVVSAGIAASASRTGLLEVLALLTLWLVWRDAAYRRWALFLAYAVAGAVLLAMGGGLGVLHRLAGDAPDCQGRRVLWTSVIELIGEHPWTGWGWDAFPLAMYRSSAQPHFCALVENAHDLPLHLAFTLGVPVAIVVCLAIGWAIRRISPWQAGSAAQQLGVPVIAVLFVHSLLEYPLWYGPFQMALGLAVGLVWQGGVGWRMSRPRVAMLTGAWLLAGAYVAVDYARVSQPYLPIEARWRWWRQDPLVDAERSWLFADLARFARLMSLPVTAQTAARVHELSGEVMRFSPAPGVIDKRIASARLLGHDTEAAEETRRLQLAYPSSGHAP